MLFRAAVGLSILACCRSPKTSKVPSDSIHRPRHSRAQLGRGRGSPQKSKGVDDWRIREVPSGVPGNRVLQVFGPKGERGAIDLDSGEGEIGPDLKMIKEVEASFRSAYEKVDGLMERRPMTKLIRWYKLKRREGHPVIFIYYECVEDEAEVIKRFEERVDGHRTSTFNGKKVIVTTLHNGDCNGDFTYNFDTKQGQMSVD